MGAGEIAVPDGVGGAVEARRFAVPDPGDPVDAPLGSGRGQLGALHGSCGQFLVRSREPRRPFSVEGDSGAVVRDEAGSPVGLIWGTTPSGASIATPIWAVVDVLGLQLVQLVRLVDVAKADRQNDDMQVRMLQ